jgi:hypothetical protein
MAVCKRLKTQADYQQWQNLECPPVRHDVSMPTGAMTLFNGVSNRSDSGRLERRALVRLMVDAGTANRLEV